MMVQNANYLPKVSRPKSIQDISALQLIPAFMLNGILDHGLSRTYHCTR